MEPPLAAAVETKSEKTDETERAKSYNCELCDTEVVYKIAQELLPGLASSCVDNTTGGLFTSAGSVAVDMRKDMADYLTQRSETYVADFLLSENANGLEISEHPYDIIVNLIDDFAAIKRNMFSRVSEWVLSDRREDRIDDFVQEMEINGFWLFARREHIASMLLKNVDYKNAFHCNLVFNSEEEVIKHRSECKFRPMDCKNEGCTTRYCAAQKEHHEAVCPFMILPCEQKCSDFVMRREMDRHCVTICPMKLVKCAFYTVGCKSNIPRCDVQQHNADDLSSHLLYIIRTAHKEAIDEDLKHRVEQIRNQSNIEKLARARDARALTFLIKDFEAKLGPLEVKTNPNAGESADSASDEDSIKKESSTKTESLPAVVKDGPDSPNKQEEHLKSTEKTAIEKEDATSPVESTTTKERSADSPVKIEERSVKKDEKTESQMKKEVSSDSEKEDGKVFTPKENEKKEAFEENRDKKDEKNESPMKKEVSSDSEKEDSKVLATKENEKKESPIKGTFEESNDKKDEKNESLMKKEVSSDSEKEDSKVSAAKETEKKESPIKETFEEQSQIELEETMQSPKGENLKNDPIKSPKNETTKESKKSPEEEKNKKLSSSDEEDTKESPKQETFEESSIIFENSSMKPPEKETFEESSIVFEDSSMKLPEKETFEDSSMKLSEKETFEESSIVFEDSSMKLPEKETFEDSSMKLPEKETFEESSIVFKDSSMKLPEKETANESSDQRDKTDDPSDSDDEESMKSPIYYSEVEDAR